MASTIFKDKDLYITSVKGDFKPLAITEVEMTPTEIKINADTGFIKDIIAGIDLSKPQIKVELPERYIINKEATILFWKNGEKTIVKRATDDEFNPRLAFLTAFFQRYSGLSKNKANKYLASLQVEEIKTKDSKQKNDTEFKVGDIVSDKRFGKGKIINIDYDDDNLQILVQFRRKNEELHSGFGLGKKNHCYWYSLNTDELTKEEK